MLNILMTYLRNIYEPVSSGTHLLAGVSFIIVSFYLLSSAKVRFPKQLSITIFCVATVLTLFMSSLYHMYSPDDPLKELLQKLDHALIFLLIVSSLTPIHHILFRGFMRWGILSIVWTFTLIVMGLKLWYFNEVPEWLGTLVYLIMGWGGAVTVYILYKRRGFGFIKPLVLGGVFYTIGALFDYFRFPVLIEGVFEGHELFHFMVILGLAFHWNFVFDIAKLRAEIVFKDFKPSDDAVAA